MLNPTGSFLEALLVDGEILEIYPLLGSSTEAQPIANPPMEALIAFDNKNYHVKFTPEMVPTGEYSVAEEYSDDHLEHIDQWQEQLLKELHIDDDSNAEMIRDWESVDDFSDVEGWDEESWEDVDWDSNEETNEQ
jgi:hypothetical protein